MSGINTEKKLNLNEQYLKEKELSDFIINSLPGIFYLYDQSGKYLRWNKNLEIISGFSREEIATIKPLQFFDESQHEKVSQAIEKVFKEGHAEIEVEALSKTGEKMLFYFNGYSVMYEGKLCLMGIGIDLTEREIAQVKVRESEKKYRSLFEQASDPILITDFEGNFTDVNGSLCKLFGYTKKELLRMNIKSLVCHLELKERPLRMDLLKQGKHFFSERRMVRKDGAIIETEANLKKFGEDEIMAIVRDVTEIRNLQRVTEKERMTLREQEQKKITRAVIKAQERERNMIGRDLHDNVNQLLASARICLSTAKTKPEGKKEFVNESIRLIDSTIHEIRILSRSHVTPMTGFDLGEQIISLVKQMQEGIGFSISLENELPDQINLQDDLKLNIYRILQEQLNNVYKHASATRAQVKIFLENENICINITDNGIGYEIGLKKNGVGIVNIINRVESFNGKVSLETKPGVGFKLNIRIPLVY